MKTLTLIIALVLSINFSNAQDSKTGKDITVTIENITNNNGKVILGLHTEDTFMKGQGIKTAEANIVDGKITVTFKNIEAGTYAIMALHDENENKRMDYQDSGMPKESYGMSNNPMSFGPPQFAAAKFELKNENLDLKIIF
ncbi:DUF2141 domain-containing protein [Algibacter sp. R77976]|uniref:DUF2141 domain-containing protein n=1 Tax=Algibacter sp. R77976 TaxID=3093873 RepID=UPI0037CC62E4